MQHQHCAGFAHDVFFFQFCFGRLRNATHFLLSLDFLIGVTFSHAEISDVCIYIYIYMYIIYIDMLARHSLKASFIFQYMLGTLSWRGRRGGVENTSC